MTKQEVIKDATMKAAMCKQDQVVYKYKLGGDPAGWTRSTYDYTHANLWPRRRSFPPIVTLVTSIKYVPQPIGGPEH